MQETSSLKDKVVYVLLYPFGLLLFIVYGVIQANKKRKMYPDYRPPTRADRITRRDLTNRNRAKYGLPFVPYDDIR